MASYNWAVVDLTVARQEHQVQHCESMKHGTKNHGVRTPNRPLNEAPNSLDTTWHFVSIGYGGHLLGLLVETDDETEARRAAEEVCNWFGAPAKVLDARKVVAQ